MTETLDNWPAGATWVFQGTVAEDGTGGTHVCTLTITPGSGNEMQVLYANGIVGNSATAQTFQILVDDGTNLIAQVYNSAGASGTTANLQYPWPTNVSTVASATVGLPVFGDAHLTVSGTMRFILKISTAAISVTQTFSVVCRIKVAMPTAVLADTVGTPALTVNTNKVF